MLRLWFNTIVSGKGEGWYLLKRFNPLHLFAPVLSKEPDVHLLLFVDVVHKCFSFLVFFFSFRLDGCFSLFEWFYTSNFVGPFIACSEVWAKAPCLTWMERCLIGTHTTSSNICLILVPKRSIDRCFLLTESLSYKPGAFDNYYYDSEQMLFILFLSLIFVFLLSCFNGFTSCHVWSFDLLSKGIWFMFMVKTIHWHMLAYTSTPFEFYWIVVQMTLSLFCYEVMQLYKIKTPKMK